MKKYINENRALIFGCFCIAVFTIYVIVKQKMIDRNGVYTIAKVTKYEGDANGSSLYLDVYLNGKIFNAVVNMGCSNCIGKFYFIKVLKNDPANPLLYKDKLVPDCILNKTIPSNGWEKLPKCN